MRGTIDGTRYWLGNHRLVEELERCSTALEAKLDALERQGKSVVVLVDEARVLGIFAVADTIRTRAVKRSRICMRSASAPRC